MPIAIVLEIQPTGEVALRQVGSGRAAAQIFQYLCNLYELLHNMPPRRASAGLHYSAAELRLFEAARSTPMQSVAVWFLRRHYVKIKSFMRCDPAHCSMRCEYAFSAAMWMRPVPPQCDQS